MVSDGKSSNTSGVANQIKEVGPTITHAFVEQKACPSPTKARQNRIMSLESATAIPQRSEKSYDSIQKCQKLLVVVIVVQWSLHNSNLYNSNVSLTRANSLAPWKFPDKLL